MKIIYKLKILIIIALVACIGFANNICLTFAQTGNELLIESNGLNYILQGLNELKDVDVQNEFRLERVSDVAYGKVYKFIQLANGYDVYGSELIVSVNKQGKILSTSGEYKQIPQLVENVSEQDAMDIVTELAGGEINTTQKIVFALEHEPVLAYEIITYDAKYFISAQDGEILKVSVLSSSELVPKMQTDAFGNEVWVNVEYDGKFTYALGDFTKNIFTIDAKNQESISSNAYYQNGTGVFDPMAVTVFSNVVKAYDFYTDAKNIGVSLNGINNGNDNISNNYNFNNSEIPIIVYVHYGNNYQNAACQYFPDYNQVLMVVGDGNSEGYLYQPGKALDILAHEYQHAVTAFHSGLVYSGDSGAIDEAFSDIFGALIEGYDLSDENFWNIGELATTSSYNTVRSMSGNVDKCVMPGRYNMSERYTCPYGIWHRLRGHDDSCDNGGVHYNSTIVSHVQYKLCQAMPEYFTKERIGTLWFSTLCALSTNATFDEFGEQFLQAAENLDFSEEACDAIYDVLKDAGLLPYHTVTFVDYDDSVISKQVVIHGGTVSYPENPSREADEMYSYVFESWDTYIDKVTEDVVIKAEYNETIRSYIVTLIDGDDNVVDTKTLNYGDVLKIKDIAEPKPSDSKKVFIGWYVDEERSIIAEDITVYGDMSLYAKWEERRSTGPCGTITFAGGGGAGLMAGLLVVILLYFMFVFTKKRKASR